MDGRLTLAWTSEYEGNFEPSNTRRLVSSLRLALMTNMSTRDVKIRLCPVAGVGVVVFLGREEVKGDP